ncbi:MAG: S9 family peptidase, partial [Chloroflexia bacterium]|nr:S9 family peptidase [Chloroflexia bacterium]
MTLTGTITGLTPERLIFDLRAAGQPAMAPDGSRIVYSLSAVDRETKQTTSQLWAIDLDGGNPVQLTFTGRTNGNPVWSPDGSSIAFVSKGDGEKPYAIRILPIDGGESREVIRHVASPSSLDWSPDGSSLAYTLPVDPDNPIEEPVDVDVAPKVRAFRRLDYKQDNRGYLYDTRLQVVVVDVESGTCRQLTSDLIDHTDPRWSPDGRQIAMKVLNRNGMHQQLAVLEVATGECTLVGDADWTVGTFRWSRDGSSILFDGDERNSAQTDYFRYDVAVARLHRLTTDLPFSPEAGYPTIGSPAQPAWISDDVALVHGVQAGASGLWTVNARSGEITEVARFEATHSGLSVDDAGRYVAQTISTPLGTGEISVFDRETGASRVVTHVNDAVFAESPVGSFEKCSVERGGETIDYWITYPPEFDETRQYPVVLDVHGGPHGNFGYSFGKGTALLAGAGTIVVSSNPRGSGTYGRRFANLVRGDWGGGDWLDVQAALDAVLERPYADADRTGIMGYSYGGFMTAWALGHTDRFRAAVCGAPVFDLESFYGTSDIGHVWGAFQWGGELPEHREWLVEHSPSTHIHNATTPTLIVHGEQDHRCPIGQGEQMFTALSRQGVEVEFVRYPGGAHLML